MVRPAAELRAAAVATGWFDGPRRTYRGDGYSIPWQTGYFFSPTIGFTLDRWKQYLDQNYPEPARLHDWLYTPYGVDLIQCTQEEADLALREEMLAEGIDSVQAEVVYRACQLGGGLYFGVSSVDYVAPALPSGGDNMEPASSGGGGEVSTYKVQMVFQNTTTGFQSNASLGYTVVPRTAGWSEGIYFSGLSPADIRLIMTGPRNTGLPAILPSRAQILPLSARLIGYRLYDIAGGRGQFIPLSYPGTYTQGDVPSMALLCATTFGSSPSVRRFTIRGIPDNQVTQGEFLPTSIFVTELKAYFDSLTNTAFYGRVTVPTQEIFSISNAGLLTAQVPLTYTAGAFVQITMTLGPTGNRLSGQYLVQSIGPLNNQITLANWTFGATTGGKVSQPAKAWVFTETGNTSAVRITNHKVGRPFAGYRGRNSVRR